MGQFDGSPQRALVALFAITFRLAGESFSTLASRPSLHRDAPVPPLSDSCRRRDLPTARRPGSPWYDHTRMEKTHLRDFSAVNFPPKSGTGFIYILCWLSGDEEVPFYVGETQSIWGRLNDYYWAQFQAPTDFRVGEAVRYLSTKNIHVVARYKPSVDRSCKERAIINELRAEGRRLLNDLPVYDYRTADEEQERIGVQKQVDWIIGLSGRAPGDAAAASDSN